MHLSGRNNQCELSLKLRIHEHYLPQFIANEVPVRDKHYVQRVRHVLLFPRITDFTIPLASLSVTFYRGKVFQEIMFPTCIRKMPISNLGQFTGYPQVSRCSPLPSLQVNAWTAPCCRSQSFIFFKKNFTIHYLLTHENLHVYF